MGYRLPLDSLPWAAAGDRPTLRAPDPMQRFADLPPHSRLQFQSSIPASTVVEARPGPFESAARITRTTLCAEPRNGVLYVFMPPVEALEDYLELVAAIEATAADLGFPVVLEGYEPPKDPRLESFRITPDPGVLEVNVHPAASWGDLVGEHRVPLRAGAADAPHHREIHARRPPLGHRRRQPLRARRAERRRFAVPAPPRPAREPARLLAQPPLALVSVLGDVRRPDQPGAAHRRGAERLGLRDRDRLQGAGKADRARTARPG